MNNNDVSYENLNTNLYTRMIKLYIKNVYYENVDRNLLTRIIMMMCIIKCRYKFD